MSESPELTPKEQYHASLYKDPSHLFRVILMRRLAFIIPSAVLMIIWFVTGDRAYAICGYGLLLFQAVESILLARKGIRTTNRILNKQESKGPL